VHDRERSGSPNFQRRRDASAPGHNPYPANQRLCRRHVRSRAERTARRRRLCASTLPPPSTRRTGASPPAPTDHPTRKEKKKERKAGAAPTGSVESKLKTRAGSGRRRPGIFFLPRDPTISGEEEQGNKLGSFLVVVPRETSEPLAGRGWRWLPAAGRRRAGQPRAGCRAAEPAPPALVLCDDRWGGGRRRAHRTVGVHLKFGCPQAHRGPGDGVHQLVPAARQSVVRCMHPATGSAPRETNCWTARTQMV